MLKLCFFMFLSGAPVMTPPSAGCGTNQTSQKTFLCFQPVVEILAGLASLIVSSYKAVSDISNMKKKVCQ